MKKALVVFGGVSSEHDVSLVSASSVIKNIPTDKYEIVMLGITKDGRWLLYTGSPDALPSGKWLEDTQNCIPAVLSPDSNCHGILVFDQTGVTQIKIDVAFPVLHGKNGEDGTIQGLFELADIPYVGCNHLSSAMCMDKAITNTIADFAGIAQAKWCAIQKFEYEQHPEAFLNHAIELLGFPIFVKPANSGSSVGISKAVDINSLKTAMRNAFVHDKKVVLEQNINGHEVECAVLGNEEPIASVVGEIVPCNDFYDYEAKYIADSSELHIPARLAPEKLEEVRQAAKKAYIALGCTGLSRVDFFVRKEDQAVLLNEINTIPGFTSISMYPKLFEASGIQYSDLLDRLFEFAIRRKNG